MLGFCAHMKMVTRRLTALSPQVSRFMNMETVLTLWKLRKYGVYLGTARGLGKIDFASNAVLALKQRDCHSTMSDSILITMLLNEDNALENTWVIYLVFALLTGLYCVWYNLVSATVYAGISLEIILRLLEFFVQSAVMWAFRRRHPTMTAV